MVNRINVKIEERIVGTVPAFPNGMGQLSKSELAQKFGPDIKVATTYGDISSLTFRTISDAKRFPGFKLSVP